MREEHTFDTKLNNELPVEVKFTYIEGYPQTREAPAEDAEIEVYEVLLVLRDQDGEIIDRFDLIELLSEDAISALESNCLHYVHQQPEPEELEDFD